MRSWIAAAALALVPAHPALSQEVDFGDDSSIWANDGECDDPRFEGPGMAPPPNLSSNIRADASDCRAAFEAGQVTLAEDAGAEAAAPAPREAASPDAMVADGIDFGDDSSIWANDGECDDPRFEGPGMTATPLLDEDTGADATDCMTAYLEGRLTLRDGAPAALEAPETIVVDGVVFGDDSSEWANDGECDDRRFFGPGLARNIDWINVGRDASDCRALLEAGQVRIWDFDAAKAATRCDAIDFGQDTAAYTNDGECDDPRFEGFAAAKLLTEDDIGADATDCRRACEFGLVVLRDY